MSRGRCRTQQLLVLTKCDANKENEKRVKGRKTTKTQRKERRKRASPSFTTEPKSTKPKQRRIEMSKLNKFVFVSYPVCHHLPSRLPTQFAPQLRSEPQRERGLLERKGAKRKAVRECYFAAVGENAHNTLPKWETETS